MSPLPAGTRYRMKKTSKGMVRLAFAKGTNKVIEAKNMKTGDVHTNWDDLHSVAKRMSKRK